MRGGTTYRETSDFAKLRNARYQYSPYLFEALLQLVNFYIVAMDPSERRSMIPMEIGEMQVFAKMPGRGTDNAGGPHAGAGRRRSRLGRQRD